MSQPAITLEVLPAGFGDCLLVSCPVGRSTWRMLVDTGPDETYPALRRRLMQIPKDSDGKGSQMGYDVIGDIHGQGVARVAAQLHGSAAFSGVCA